MASNRGSFWGTAGVSAFVSLGVTAASTFLVDDFVNSRSELRTARLEQALAFSNSDAALLAAAGLFMQTIAVNGDVAPLRSALRLEILKEQRLADNLRLVFGSAQANAIDEYQASLEKFAETLKSADSPLTMRPWVETFGQVNDARQSLARELSAGSGVSS